MPNPIDILPQIISAQIFEYLDIKDILASSLVSRQWHKKSWEIFVRRNYHILIKSLEDRRNLNELKDRINTLTQLEEWREIHLTIRSTQILLSDKQCQQLDSGQSMARMTD